MIDYSQIRIFKLTEDTSRLTADFDCGKQDINKFLSIDALKYLDGKLAVTYLIEYQGELKAFFCLSNADIKVNEEDIENFDELEKHLPEYPALRIGQLGVKEPDQGKGIGTLIIQHVIGRALAQSNEVGCRFLAVDSLNDKKSIRLYESNGFKRLIDGKTRKNVPMYLDLLKIKG